MPEMKFVVPQAGDCTKCFTYKHRIRDLEERVANILQAIQEHAESGNIDNYVYLSDKIKALTQDDLLSKHNSDPLVSKDDKGNK